MASTANEEKTGLCFLCQRTASLRCDECPEETWICHDFHGMLHRDTPAAEHCFPFVIKNRPQVGRYLEASRFIPAGSVIFQEEALLLGPTALSGPQCLFCFKSLPDDSSLCRCGYPICGSSCSGNVHSGRRRLHHLESGECQILSRLTADREFRTSDGPVAEPDKSLMYEPLLPLRLLLLRQQDPEAFAGVASLMDHEEDRQRDDDYYARSLDVVIRPLAKALAESEELVSKMVGIVEINQYNLSHPASQAGVRALYCITSRMSHSCVPNARPITSLSSHGRCVCIASVDIHKGQEISITYINQLLPTWLRQETLMSNWYFECECDRCGHPTEMDSFVSAVKCSRTDCQGFLLPLWQPKQSKRAELYQCQVCHSRTDVSLLVDKIRQQKERLDRTDIQAHLDFVAEALQLLHPHHFLLLSAYKWILPLYCRSNRPHAYDAQMLQTKMQMAQRMLSVLHRLDPGITKSRGRVLFELADAQVKLMNLDDDLLSPGEFPMRINECLDWLRDCVCCLSRESRDSFEGEVSRAAEMMVLQLKQLQGSL